MQQSRAKRVQFQLSSVRQTFDAGDTLVLLLPRAGAAGGVAILTLALVCREDNRVTHGTRKWRRRGRSLDIAPTLLHSPVREREFVAYTCVVLCMVEYVLK